MARKTTSLKIDEQVWKDLKIHCIKIDREISEYLEQLIKESLKKGGKREK